MRKKVLSVILLCLIIVAFVSTVVLGCSTGISIYSIYHNEIDTSNDVLPGASILVLASVFFAIWIALLLLFFVSSVGWLSSFANSKVASNRVIKTISLAFMYYYSVVLLLSIGILTYIMIAPYLG